MVCIADLFHQQSGTADTIEKARVAEVHRRLWHVNLGHRRSVK
jgi:hypothetical protein